ncbi:MAG: porphobilinogen synthase [Thermodesulfobacteriota bacterium]
MGKSDIPSKDIPSLELNTRLRRNRKSQSIRNLVRETIITPHDLIYPLFIHSKQFDEDIESMPGCKRWSIEGLINEAKRASQLGIGAVILFPAIDDKMKSSFADECYNPDGLIPKAVRRLKKEIPEITVITDIALDPYSSDGHDGVLSPKGEILNDITVDILCKQALCHAKAGADIISPSDMMDGRIGAIREVLDEEEFTNVSIMSYTSKYASSFYGPFRGALDSAPKSGDKKSYQMDPANSREALRELIQDEEEGADIVMVKPAGYYLDIVYLFKENTDIPVAAYQVSGEYLMIKAAAKSGWLDENSVILESLLSIKRAGADIIITYFAAKAAELLNK